MKKLINAWYQGSPWLVFLKPLAMLFERLAKARRSAYLTGVKPAWYAPVPVVVVGNITVGGVGKTPLVAALVKLAREVGFTPGIVSRGYGGKAPHYPYLVSATSDVLASGDEPLMLARRCACPVVIDADRSAATQYLLQNHSCDLVISDDGLQHYALGRDLEIVVLDGARGLGNGQFLPAGPLRESPQRLQEADWIVINGEGGQCVDDFLRADGSLYAEAPQFMQLKACQLVNLQSGERKPIDALADQEVHALAGIGNPQRFFTALQQQGYRLQRHDFPDHHAFQSSDLPANDGLAIIMTEKDAVKCAEIADERCWYLSVDAQLDDKFIIKFQRQLKDLAGLKKLARGRG